VIDVELVLARYKKKRWEAVSYQRLEGPPESIRIGLRREKEDPPRTV
jgi:hypothetical protein